MSALVGAGAAFTAPGPTGSVAAGGALLAVAALALLAGHAWGASLVVPSHVTLAGRVAPELASHDGPLSPATVIVLVSSLPALVIGLIALARWLDHRRSRRSPTVT